MWFQPEIAVTLPHGLWDADGVCHRRAVVRALSGNEELMLPAAGALDPPAVSDLLARCLARLGGYDQVDAALTAGLTRGDRSFLALRLRAQLYGDRMPLIVRCQNPVCGAAADVDLRVSQIAPEPEDEPAPEELRVDTPSGPATVREPTGEDDAVVAAAPGDRKAKAALLWSRLVEIGGKDVTPEAWAALPARTRNTIALALADGSRAPELSFIARCPTCRAWLELSLDPFALLSRELAAGADRLLAELHCLAFHYHWSEQDILALPRPRRWRYLELLRRELEGHPLVDYTGRS